MEKFCSFENCHLSFVYFANKFLSLSLKTAMITGPFYGLHIVERYYYGRC